MLFSCYGNDRKERNSFHLADKYFPQTHTHAHEKHSHIQPQRVFPFIHACKHKETHKTHTHKTHTYKKHTGYTTPLGEVITVVLLVQNIAH